MGIARDGGEKKKKDMEWLSIKAILFGQGDDLAINTSAVCLRDTRRMPGPLHMQTREGVFCPIGKEIL